VQRNDKTPADASPKKSIISERRKFKGCSVKKKGTVPRIKGYEKILALEYHLRGAEGKKKKTDISSFQRLFSQVGRRGKQNVDK